MIKAIKLNKKNLSKIMSVISDESTKLGYSSWDWSGVNVALEKSTPTYVVLDTRKKAEKLFTVVTKNAFSKKFEFIYSEKDGEFARVRQLA